MRCFDSALLEMSSLGIFFSVTMAMILPLNVVDSKSPQDLDDIILEYVNQQKIQGLQKEKRITYDTLSESSESLDEDRQIDLTRFGRLRHEGINNLIDIATLYKNKDHDVTPKIRKEIYGKQFDRFEKSQPKDMHTSFLEQLLSKGISKVKPKRNFLGGRPKNRLEPTLLQLKLNDDNGDSLSGLENYSKIYIMLNPSAAPRNSNKKALNDLVSKMLSQYSTNEHRQSKSKLPRYKGFLVDDNIRSRRLRRESREMYAPNSMEADHKQKRNRNNGGGGGGGGGGGRTAIPYMGHRGDIYEKNA